jgi:hypothetical protein
MKKYYKKGIYHKYSVRRLAGRRFRGPACLGLATPCRRLSVGNISLQ